MHALVAARSGPVPRENPATATPALGARPPPPPNPLSRRRQALLYVFSGAVRRQIEGAMDDALRTVGRAGRAAGPGSVTKGGACPMLHSNWHKVMPAPLQSNFVCANQLG
jgi:hypothetical protein